MCSVVILFRLKKIIYVFFPPLLLLLILLVVVLLLVVLLRLLDFSRTVYRILTSFVCWLVCFAHANYLDMFITVCC